MRNGSGRCERSAQEGEGDRTPKGCAIQLLMRWVSRRLPSSAKMRSLQTIFSLAEAGRDRGLSQCLIEAVLPPVAGGRDHQGEGTPGCSGEGARCQAAAVSGQGSGRDQRVQTPSCPRGRGCQSSPGSWDAAQHPPHARHTSRLNLLLQHLLLLPGQGAAEGDQVKQSWEAQAMARGHFPALRLRVLAPTVELHLWLQQHLFLLLLLVIFMSLFSSTLPLLQAVAVSRQGCTNVLGKTREREKLSSGPSLQSQPSLKPHIRVRFLGPNMGKDTLNPAAFPHDGRLCHSSGRQQGDNPHQPRLGTAQS